MNILTSGFTWLTKGAPLPASALVAAGSAAGWHVSCSEPQDEASRRLDKSLRGRSLNWRPIRRNCGSLARSLSLSGILTVFPFLTMKDMSQGPAEEPWVTLLEKTFEVTIPLTSKAGSGRGIHLPQSWSSSPLPLALPSSLLYQT